MKQHRHLRHRDTAVFPRVAYSATWFVPPPHPSTPTSVTCAFNTSSSGGKPNASV